MSAREEERQKNSCSSRGLGIAAAAIGVGVGAALYYFFNKKQENPSTEGSSSDWTCERQQTFGSTESDDSYTTVSEYETTDTSMQTSDDSTFVFEEETDYSDSSTSTEDDDDESSENDSDFDLEAAIAESHDMSTSNSEDMTSQISSDSELDSREWDVTTSSTDIPENMNTPHGGIADTTRLNRNKTDELKAIKRQEAFRERSWTLEECSICFDVMLTNQEVTSLPCAHNFHTECIMPWLQEKQNCPNCRKVAE